ncbi:SPL family radical SAM protein [Anaerocolumna sp. MB42-C2]|uniref:SPL family radical SAM protein n=1 Tax=Anaerocolumna sp. MB42-C2 TaxID=3070997 RepID=UPI0027DF5ABA|nr:radical SAM protein [Anaerocolumna sp. MB42-C2]WMJ86501.1 radical SAM protein [Anaerocolumna sp. MB42-C2]
MQYIPAKTIITKTKNTSWFGTDYNMNIYKGCCHGCIYCDSRSDCYRVDQFDTVRAKDNALEIIRDELRRKVKTGVIGTGAMSDPYNPFEKELSLTRHALELADAFHFGIAVATKGTLITRDIDILQSIKEHSPVICKITITNTDDAISGLIEPNTAPSSQRFEAVRKLSEAGIFIGILFMPVLPFISDNKENIVSMVSLAKKNGAKFIYPAFGVTLRNNQREYFYEKLDEVFPDLKMKYISRYGDRYQCTSPNARELYRLFAHECEENHILYNMKDIIAGYKSGYEYNQLSLFDNIF